MKLLQAIHTYIHTYTFSQYFHGRKEKIIHGIRNENIESLSYPDNTFDIVICLDVLEHIFHPQYAIREMLRVVKQGGIVIFTTPILKITNSLCRAVYNNDNIEYLLPPIYHGNPISSKGSLVTWDYGYDFYEHIHEWLTGFKYSYTIERDINFEHGIAGEYLEVFIFKKH